MSNIKLNYRPEIDGLRAIAVVSVILILIDIKPVHIVNFFTKKFCAS